MISAPIYLKSPTSNLNRNAVSSVDNTIAFGRAKNIEAAESPEKQQAAPKQNKMKSFVTAGFFSLLGLCGVASCDNSSNVKDKDYEINQYSGGKSVRCWVSEDEPNHNHYGTRSSFDEKLTGKEAVVVGNYSIEEATPNSCAKTDQ